MNALEDVHEVVSGHLEEIARLFKQGAKLTLLVRRPEFPDGSQDFVATNDALDEAINALHIRAREPNP